MEAASLSAPAQPDQHERPTTPPSKIMESLAILARNGGNVKQTALQVGIERTTLRQWRDWYRDDYQSLQERMRQKLEDELVGALCEGSLEATEAARLAVQRAHEKLQKDEDKRPAQTAQQLATTSGIWTDKRMLLEGRPTSIQAQASVEEDLRFLRTKAIPDAEVVEERPSVSPPKTTEGTEEGKE